MKRSIDAAVGWRRAERSIDHPLESATARTLRRGQSRCIHRESAKYIGVQWTAAQAGPARARVDDQRCTSSENGIYAGTMRVNVVGQVFVSDCVHL